MSDIDSLLLPADEVGLSFDKFVDVLVRRDPNLHPGSILVVRGVLPPPGADLVCGRASDLDGLSDEALLCVLLDEPRDAETVRAGRVVVTAAPLKPVETVEVRVDARTAPIREGTLLSRSTRSSGLYRVVDGQPLINDEVIYVAAGPGEGYPSSGSVRVPAHRVSRKLGPTVMGRILPTLRRAREVPAASETVVDRDVGRAREAASILTSTVRPPLSPEELPHLDEVAADEPLVEVLMLNGEAERTVEGMVLVPCDVRFYGDRKWHVYERRNEWNAHKENQIVATGAKLRRAPEDYMRIVTARGTLPPDPPGERMEDELIDEGEDDILDDTDSWASDEGVKLLERAATPEVPPHLVQVEAADALVSAMRAAEPRRTSAKEAACRLLGHKDLAAQVLVRLVAGLTEQGDRPEVAYVLARSEVPYRRAASAFLLPVDHLPFLLADPDEHVRRAAKLAADPEKLVSRAFGGNLMTGVKTLILHAAGADDDSALSVLASLWGPNPEPPEKIDEALRALDLSEAEDLSGVGESEDAEHADLSVEELADLWGAEDFSGVPKTLLSKERRRTYSSDTRPMIPLRARRDHQAVGRKSFFVDDLPEVTDEHPTRLDPLADLRMVANLPSPDAPVVRRNAIPLDDTASRMDENAYAIIKRATLRAIQQLECAVCGSKVSRTVDPRQAGVCPIGYEWVNYRCTRDPSHLVVDRSEPVTYKADPEEERLALQDEAARQQQRDREKTEAIRDVVRICLAEAGLLREPPKDAEPSSILPEEERAMDEVFGPRASLTHTVGRLDPSEIPEGTDGPLGADPDDPEVQQIGRSLWGDEKQIVSEAAHREADRNLGLAEAIDRKSPEAIARLTVDASPPVHHAQVVDGEEAEVRGPALSGPVHFVPAPAGDEKTLMDAEDARTFALMDKAADGLSEELSRPQDEAESDPSGQQMQDAMALAAGTNGAS